MGKRAKKDRSNTFSRGIEPCVVSDASDADRGRGGWQSRGSSTAARRDRLAARTSAVSRALDGRAGRTRSRSSPRETPAIGEERATGEHSLRRPCRTGGARTRTHLSPCPSFHESLNPPAATLRSTRDMTWNGGSAASASDALVMAPAAPPGTLCQAMRAFRPSSPRAPRPPGVRPTARGRALPPAEPCPPGRTAVRRARGCGATNAAAPGLARDARRRGSRSPRRNLGQQCIACRSKKTCRSKPRGQAPVDAFQRPDILRCSLYGHLVWKRDGFFGTALRVLDSCAKERTLDGDVFLFEESRTFIEENATSALQRAVLARAIPTPPTLPIRA